LALRLGKFEQAKHTTTIPAHQRPHFRLARGVGIALQLSEQDSWDSDMLYNKIDMGNEDGLQSICRRCSSNSINPRQQCIARPVHHGQPDGLLVREMTE
jgi:hypothetical protein